MAAIYKVTARALNLRSAPTRTATAIATMPSGALVSSSGASEDPAWRPVTWNGYSGYASATYLALQVQTGEAPPPANANLPPAPSVETRDRKLEHLHPRVREAVTATLATLNQAGIPFALFEGFRTPERQDWLYAQGRTRPGGIVTRARPWQSYHQYGLACDLVLFENGGWSWNTAGPRAGWWTQMEQVARTHHLRTLSFERPHVEYDGPDWSALQKGAAFPDEGDVSWWENLSLNAARWRRSGRTPAAPPLDLAQRPDLDA